MKVLKWIGIVFGGLIVLGVIGNLMGGSADGNKAIEQAASEAGAGAPAQAKAKAEPAAEAPPAPVEPENDPGISAAEFAAIRTGMTHAEVEKIVGSPGEMMSENEMAGIRTFMVQWEGESGPMANANAMFQNGKLIQKAQFGL